VYNCYNAEKTVFSFVAPSGKQELT